MARQARPALPRGDHLHGGLEPIGKIAGQKCFSVFWQTAKDQPRLVFCVAGLALLLAISNFGADAGVGKNLQQHRIGYSTIDDVRAIHPALDCV